MTKKPVKPLFVQGLYASNVEFTENGRVPSVEELEEFAHAVLYVPFGGLLPFGFWRERGFAFEYPALIPTKSTDRRLREVEANGSWVRQVAKAESH